MKTIDKFIFLIPKLEAVEFMGLARLLKVQVITESDPAAENVKDRFKPREFNEVFEDVLRAFNSQNRTRKREIIKLMKASISKEEVKKDAGNTKDTEAAN